MRDFQLPGRSSARSTSAMAATSHPLSTLAALDILRDGGNAIDAAVCASAVQAVVEPQSTGLGGDCTVLFSLAGEDRVRALNGSGRAPKAATIDVFRNLGMDHIPLLGPHAVTIPGAVDAWCRLLDDHGRKSISDVLAPAIHYAEQGFVVQDRVAFDWLLAMETLRSDPYATEIFLKDSKPYQAGEIHHQQALAGTLREIARDGRDAFYNGRIAEALTRRLTDVGGVHAISDFAETQSEYVEPISVDYRGYRIHQMPPNSQGIIALQMLNILSGYDLGAFPPDSAERLHLEIEAGRMAFRDRDERLGGWRDSNSLVDSFLSPQRADIMRSKIYPDRAMTHLPRLDLATSDTVYISVVDDDRNAISFINSTFYSFGSGVTCPETGVVLQNRGTSFRLDPSHPNALAPRKRPMHTIMPGMVTVKNKPVMPFGVMGGDYQPFGQAHFLTNVIDYGMSLQEALDSPRVFYEGEKVVVENGIDKAARRGLERKGHSLGDAVEPHGGGQAIWIDYQSGTLTGGSDHRKDGMALGY